MLDFECASSWRMWDSIQKKMFFLAKIDAFTDKTNESRSGLLLKAALEYIAQHQS